MVLIKLCKSIVTDYEYYVVNDDKIEGNDLCIKDDNFLMTYHGNSSLENTKKVIATTEDIPLSKLQKLDKTKIDNVILKKEYTILDIENAYNQGAFDNNAMARTFYKEIKSYKSAKDYIQEVYDIGNKWQIDAFTYKLMTEISIINPENNT